MVIEIPPMKIVSDNDRLVPVIMKLKSGKIYPRMVTSAPYKKCKEKLTRIMKSQIPKGWEPSDDIVWELFVHTYKDVTNILKILGDSLEDAGIVKNDRHLGTVFIVKYFEKRGSDDRVKMRIVNLEDNDGGEEG